MALSLDFFHTHAPQHYGSMLCNRVSQWMPGSSNPGIVQVSLDALIVRGCALHHKDGLREKPAILIKASGKHFLQAQALQDFAGPVQIHEVRAGLRNLRSQPPEGWGAMGEHDLHTLTYDGEPWPKRVCCRPTFFFKKLHIQFVQCVLRPLIWF